MIYLTAVCVGLLLALAYALYVIKQLVSEAREERGELEDRILALATPAALTHVSSVRESSPGRVMYTDDETIAEKEANNGRT